eukprot:gnl/Hemi2/24306_TR8167_c0_g1_i1.p2 gnl/Hemi2/24306_TR8167_c0_g1~~gnl/Hemi2/24306_TR8167_c0_g1_i1.p2  ORF type:complete len:137 (-),score=45.27 gnl/Hemi2/24306_TR8167_c0_g1_i1:101-511(-)
MFLFKASPDASAFKAQHCLEERQQEAIRVRVKYPDRIPVICEKARMLGTLPEIDKKKFLVPGDLTVSQFLFVVRKRIQLSPDKAIYLFVGPKNVIPATADLLSTVYEQHHDADGFLYVVYHDESIFGAVGGEGGTV